MKTLPLVFEVVIEDDGPTLRFPASSENEGGHCQNEDNPAGKRAILEGNEGWQKTDSAADVVEPHGGVGLIEPAQQVFPRLWNQLLRRGGGVFYGAGPKRFVVGRGCLRKSLRRSSSAACTTSQFLSVVKPISAGMDIAFPVGSDADPETLNANRGADATFGQVEPNGTDLD